MTSYFSAKNTVNNYAIKDNTVNYALSSEFDIRSFYVGYETNVMGNANAKYCMYKFAVDTNDFVCFQSTDIASNVVGFYARRINNDVYVFASMLDRSSTANPNDYMYIKCLIFKDSKNVVLTNNKYGLEVRAATGEVVFNSNHKILKGEHHILQEASDYVNVGYSGTYYTDQEIASIFPTIEYERLHRVAVGGICASLATQRGGTYQYFLQGAYLYNLSPTRVRLVGGYFSIYIVYTNYGTTELKKQLVFNNTTSIIVCDTQNY